MIDSITFEVDGVTIQLVNERVLIWIGAPDKDADVELPLDVLQSALSVASMLRKA
jgi:hypothetical protein